MINVEFVDFDFIIVEYVACCKIAKIRNIALFYNKHFEKCLKYYRYIFSKINLNKSSRKIYQRKYLKNFLKTI